MSESLRKPGHLADAQRIYLGVMIQRETLRSGWGGYRSTLTVRCIEQDARAIVKYYGQGNWTAQATRAGQSAYDAAERRQQARAGSSK